MSKRHAGLQSLVVFVSARKPNDADSYHDAASGDHEAPSDVLHAVRLLAAIRWQEHLGGKSDSRLGALAGASEGPVQLSGE